MIFIIFSFLWLRMYGMYIPNQKFESIRILLFRDI